jgi:hypothetical protein
VKKLTLGLLAVSVAILMITNAFAVCIPAPGCMPCGTGFTPGFWKHNIKVRLDLTNGKYSAFSRDGEIYSAGTKLTDTIMDNLLDAINGYLGASYTFPELLANLELKGWEADRTNTANWFNKVAGYGPF